MQSSAAPISESTGGWVWAPQPSARDIVKVTMGAVQSPPKNWPPSPPSPPYRRCYQVSESRLADPIASPTPCRPPSPHSPGSAAARHSVDISDEAVSTFGRRARPPCLPAASRSDRGPPAAAVTQPTLAPGADRPSIEYAAPIDNLLHWTLDRRGVHTHRQTW